MAYKNYKTFLRFNSLYRRHRFGTLISPNLLWSSDDYPSCSPDSFWRSLCRFPNLLQTRKCTSCSITSLSCTCLRGRAENYPYLVERGWISSGSSTLRSLWKINKRNSWIVKENHTRDERRNVKYDNNWTSTMVSTSLNWLNLIHYKNHFFEDLK